MGYRVDPDGNIICDTAEEAIALQRVIRKQGSVQGSSGSAAVGVEGESRWTEARFRRFLNLARGSQREFLQLLISNPDGLTDKNIRQALKIASPVGLAGVITGLSRNAKKAGVDSSEVFTKEKILIGTERKSEYKLAESFRRMADKVGDLGARE